MDGLIGIGEALGEKTLRVVLGRVVVRMLIGGIIGLILAPITYPFAPSFHKVLWWRERTTFRYWLGEALVLGAMSGVLLGMIGLWMEGKDTIE